MSSHSFLCWKQTHALQKIMNVYPSPGGGGGGVGSRGAPGAGAPPLLRQKKNFLSLTDK